MFIEGMAGIENTIVTAPSVSGEPSARFTVTRIALSPFAGGFGSLANVTTNPSVASCAGITRPLARSGVRAAPGAPQLASDAARIR